MKYLIALIILSAVGCATPPIPQEPSNIGDYGPKQSTTGQNHNIMWKCEKSSVSENSVWIDCGFTNGTQTPQSVCINVFYKRNGIAIMANNKVCSGNITGGGLTIASAAITKRRIALNELCGPSLNDCELDSIENEPAAFPVPRCAFGYPPHCGKIYTR